MKKFYITSAIAYVNAPPHCGFALELVQADSIARWRRLQRNKVFFLTGVDENSLKNVQAAEEEGISVQELCDRNTQKFKNLKKILNLSYDGFIRTSDKKIHFPGAQKLWQACKAAGDIYKKEYEGFYCVGCEAFYKDSELVDGLCPEHKTKPELVKEENYFFKLSRYQKKIEDLISKDKFKIIPEKRKNEVLSFIRGGLEDFSISRSHKRAHGWGVPVPGNPKQFAYVWFDALANYLTGIGYGWDEKKFKSLWPADLHVIGKGILRFHAVFWPAMLISAGLPLPRTLFVHDYVTFGGEKISKSLGNAIPPEEPVKKYGIDSLRFYLLHEIPTFEDGDFTYERLKESYNSQLANGLGNLVARALAMCQKYFAGKVPSVEKRTFDMVKFKGERLEGSPWLKYSKENQPEDRNFEELIEEVWASYKDSFEKLQLDKTLELVWQFCRLIDGYIQDYEPFKLIKTDKQKTAAVIYNLLESLRQIGWLIRPFLPETSDKIFEQLAVLDGEKKKILEEAEEWGGLKAGMKVKKGKLLFPRI